MKYCSAFRAVRPSYLSLLKIDVFTIVITSSSRTRVKEVRCYFNFILLVVEATGLGTSRAVGGRRIPI